ncbi:hypothetical protein AJ79_04848 [Helicocarpus griseus UAMH5409]|uniref:Uncharacterized protein n=1 Tax=Helicocarpus griseus UAMH5409 TaxID=1447875 RepID=A0A2B7XRT4_9EURO|nr:hypothetical protein AJ79_04848 [Helicocarpus griseus UAMH5409]
MASTPEPQDSPPTFTPSPLFPLPGIHLRTHSMASSIASGEPCGSGSGSGSSSFHTPLLRRPSSLIAPAIPERYASLLAPTGLNAAPQTSSEPDPQNEQDTPTERATHYDNPNQRARLLLHPAATLTTLHFSPATSTARDILNYKLRHCRTELDYFTHYQASLRQVLADPQQPISERDYLDEMGVVDRKCRPLLEELRILTRQRRAVEQDLADELAAIRSRARSRSRAAEIADAEGSGDDEQKQMATLLERAYAAALYSKSTCDEITGQHPGLREAKFRRDVVAYHAASRLEGGESQMYCHVTGWWEAGSVKVTQLVPRGVRGEEVAWLFGDAEVAWGDRKNGITLHAKIEEAMDAGAIAIVPVAAAVAEEKGSGATTDWKCILIKESYRGRIFSRDLSGHASRWNELDNKPLTFHTNQNRPAARYLFFRFIMTYLQAKLSGNTAWTDKLAASSSSYDIWPVAGEYLEKATLQSLARNISGAELPPALYAGLTFEAEADVKAVADADCEIMLAMRLREVLVEGMEEGAGVARYIGENERLLEEMRLVAGAVAGAVAETGIGNGNGSGIGSGSGSGSGSRPRSGTRTPTGTPIGTPTRTPTRNGSVIRNGTGIGATGNKEAE